MKVSMPKVLGNRELCDRLCSDLLSHTSAHAYILSGAKGSGKHLIALQFAAAMACEKRDIDGLPLPCGSCPSCRKIFSGKSPDIVWIGKDGASVKIEQIRRLLTEVPVLPNDLNDKFYMIEDADTMTPQAQNAFLLTLEEPPSFVHFFLLCEKPERLLETVRSRAPILRTEMIPRETIRDHIRNSGGNAAALLSSKPNEFEEILTIADGSVGRVLALCDEKERAPLLERRRKADILVRHILSGNKGEAALFITTLPSSQAELVPILVCVQNALRDLIALKRSEHTAPIFYTDREKACETAYSRTSQALYRAYRVVETAVSNITRNANVRVTLACMVANL